MSLNVFSNNASSLLASGITSGSTSVTVSSGEGALFPALVAGQTFVGTLQDTSGDLEVVLATARTGDTISITRAQEGTTAIAFASGSRFELRCTAGVMGEMLQKNGGDTMSGTTTNNGVIQQNSSGSIQGGEFTGVVRGAPGQSANQFGVPIGTGPATVGGSPVMTTANFLNELPSGVGAMVTGMICLWHGTSGTIPSGYVACDGTAGTPDLRDKFILGAGGAQPSSGGSFTSSSNSAGTPVITPTALTVAQMPAHTHVGATVTGSGDDNSQAPMPWLEGSNLQSLGTVSLPDFTTASEGGGGTHTHGASAMGGHSHTVTPPYVALFYIMKT